MTDDVALFFYTELYKNYKENGYYTLRGRNSPDQKNKWTKRFLSGTAGGLISDDALQDPGRMLEELRKDLRENNHVILARYDSEEGVVTSYEAEI